MNQTHLYIDTVTYSTPASFSDGNMVQGSQATAKGRLAEGYQLIAAAGGESRSAAFKFVTQTDIPMHSSVFIPDASTGTATDALRIINRQTVRTLTGQFRHYIYYFG